MTSTIAIIFFVFGLIIGSFLNVVIYRFNTGRNFGGRSACMSCKRTLSWYELIPVFSYLIQGGKCRGCKTRISFQYPLVELLAGLIFLFLFLKFQNLFFIDIGSFAFTFAFFSSIFALLLVVSVYDLKHKIIPDILSFIFGALAFIGMFFFTDGIFNIHIPNMLAFMSGPILALPFALLWLISNGRWIGFGDAKLALGIGWLLGLSFGLSSLVLAFWMGAIVGIALLILSKKHSMKSEVPFAPFMVIGLILVFLFSINLFPILS